MRTFYCLLLITLSVVLLFSCGTEPGYKPHPPDQEIITILCPNTAPEDTILINGVEYESVDNDLLRQRVSEKSDMTSICTTLVSDISELFAGQIYIYQNFSPPLINEFNEPKGHWDVSNVTEMSYMFFYSTFNHPIGSWDVGNVQDMSFMFEASPFNQDISDWDVSSVEKIVGMFYYPTFPLDEYEFSLGPFNKPIKNWNVISVTTMSVMFANTPFNQPIGD